MIDPKQIKLVVQEHPLFIARAGYEEIVKALNTPEEDFKVGDQNIDPVALQLLLAKEGLLDALNKEATKVEGTAASRSYAQAAINIMQMKELKAEDLNPTNIGELLQGLKVNDVLDRRSVEAIQSLQQKSISFAQYTWEEDVTGDDLKKAFPGRW